MFKMYIELDEARMERDGLDVSTAWEEIQDMVREAGDIKEITKGEYTTNISGARSYLFDLLEDTEWFMKYVNKWIIDDPALKEDVIVECRKMGIKCSY